MCAQPHTPSPRLLAATGNFLLRYPYGTGTVPVSSVCYDAQESRSRAS